MLEGDEPEIQSLRDETQAENPDVYWATDPNMRFGGTTDIAEGLAMWRSDVPHLDTFTE